MNELWRNRLYSDINNLQHAFKLFKLNDNILKIIKKNIKNDVYKEDVIILHKHVDKLEKITQSAVMIINPFIFYEYNIKFLQNYQYSLENVMTYFENCQFSFEQTAIEVANELMKYN